MHILIGRNWRDIMAKETGSTAEKIAQIFEKLAGKESDLEFTLTDFEIESSGFKAKVNGRLKINIIYSAK